LKGSIAQGALTVYLKTTEEDKEAASEDEAWFGQHWASAQSPSEDVNIWSC